MQLGVQAAKTSYNSAEAYGGAEHPEDLTTLCTSVHYQHLLEQEHHHST